MVAVDEATSLARVGVQIQIQPQVILVGHQELFHRENARVRYWIGLGVKSVQVNSPRIAPVVPSGHAIGVEHRNHFEDVLREPKG